LTRSHLLTGCSAPGPGRLASDDIPVAEWYLADIDVLDQLLQVIPWPVESGEVPYVGCVQHPDLQVQGHHGPRGPFAASGGDPCAGTELAHDVLQRAGGLQDVVHGAEQGGVRGDRDLRVLGR